MKKTAVVVFALALSMMAAVVAPVMAIGPEQAFVVGLNPNLRFAAGAVHIGRGAAGGNVLWYESPNGYSGKWEYFDATAGRGKINNAIIATISTISQFPADGNLYLAGKPTVNDNKWIYLSPEGSGNHFQFPLPSPLNALGSHGMIWWLFYLGFGRIVSVADNAAAQYPNGVFWQYNFVKLS